MANKMRKNELENIIQEFKIEIRKFVGSNLKTILLFGSYARGDAVEGSDIDLLLIFENDVKKEGILV